MADRICKCGNDQFKIARNAAKAMSLMTCVRCGRSEQHDLSITESERNAAIVDAACAIEHPLERFRRGDLVDTCSTEGKTLLLQSMIGSDWTPDGKRLPATATETEAKKDGPLRCGKCGRTKFDVAIEGAGNGKSVATFTCESCRTTRRERFAIGATEARRRLAGHFAAVRRRRFFERVERRMDT